MLDRQSDRVEIETESLIEVRLKTISTPDPFLRKASQVFPIGTHIKDCFRRSESSVVGVDWEWHNLRYRYCADMAAGLVSVPITENSPPNFHWKVISRRY